MEHEKWNVYCALRGSGGFPRDIASLIVSILIELELSLWRAEHKAKGMLRLLPRDPDSFQFCGDYGQRHPDLPPGNTFCYTCGWWSCASAASPPRA